MIGEIQSVWCRHFISYGSCYFRHWCAERKNCTGLLFQKGAHDIDVIHWLANGYARWMVAMGNPRELRKAADDLEVINEAGRQAYLAKAGDKLDEAELVAMMDAETWLTAESCIRLGLADRYADYDANMENAVEVLQQANLTLSQRISYHQALAAQLNQLMAEDDSKGKTYLKRIKSGAGMIGQGNIGNPPDTPAQAARDAPEDKPVETNKILQLFARKGA